MSSVRIGCRTCLTHQVPCSTGVDDLYFVDHGPDYQRWEWDLEPHCVTQPVLSETMYRGARCIEQPRRSVSGCAAFFKTMMPDGIWVDEAQTCHSTTTKFQKLREIRSNLKSVPILLLSGTPSISELMDDFTHWMPIVGIDITMTGRSSSMSTLQNCLTLTMFCSDPASIPTNDLPPLHVLCSTTCADGSRTSPSCAA